jgi:hypothetical protein
MTKPNWQPCNPRKAKALQAQGYNVRLKDGRWQYRGKLKPKASK